MAKPFSDAAAANAAHIQAALDYQAAITKARGKFVADQTKIHGNLQQSQFDARIEAAQAQQERAQQAAQQGPPEDVVGPPNLQQVPMPQATGNAGQPGAGTVNIDPSQVAGGAQIQSMAAQAASGMGGGGAPPGPPIGTNPLSGPAAVVPPTITQQTQRQAVTPQQIGPATFMGVPTSEVTTRTVQNALTPYEAGMLGYRSQEVQALARYRQFQANEKLKESLAHGLGSLTFAAQNGQVSPADLKEQMQSLITTAQANGMGPSDIQDILSRANIYSVKEAQDAQQKEFASQTELVKLQIEQKKHPPGSKEYNEIQGNINKLITDPADRMTPDKAATIVFKGINANVAQAGKGFLNQQSGFNSITALEDQYDKAEKNPKQFAPFMAGFDSALLFAAARVDNPGLAARSYTLQELKNQDISADLKTKIQYAITHDGKLSWNLRRGLINSGIVTFSQVQQSQRDFEGSLRNTIEELAPGNGHKLPSIVSPHVVDYYNSDRAKQHLNNPAAANPTPTPTSGPPPVGSPVKGKGKYAGKTGIYQADGTVKFD